ncbi:hypothetical protein AALP_AA6G197800 [Arabis alpina]|uniref:Uncharacterized protein n=1 Tax=Arabis alpina TaxID=50452 RepID=A0A087GQD6_ARAAL|nr:hypothetical protein AALP_AA6G197800 [Arabis alpina]
MESEKTDSGISSQEVEDYIKDTIDHSLGLPISMEALQKKLYTAEETQRRLRDQYLALVSRLKEKDHLIDRVRSEASINAQALKKFVDENQKLATECGNLLSQCKKWEKECFLYHQDREALMEFGNESDERAREAEARVRELEDEITRLSDQMQISKRQIETTQVDNCTPLEEDLLDSVLGSLISNDETLMGRLFLEANIHDQTCQTLLRKWDQLKPSTQKVLSLVSKAKKFEKEKECIILNLTKAEQEVELVSKQNRELDKENRRLLRKQQSPLCSGERTRNSASTKSNKRKSPKMMSSPVEKKKLEFSSPEISRKPLSPVWDNSPDSRINSK